VIKGYSVGCCGCGRLLKKDGSLTVAVVSRSGVLDLGALDLVREDLASFDVKSECDSFALAHGFSVRDGNHRCPECTRIDPLPERRGMYIDTRLMEVSHGQ
jgi:hypothetical protein